MISRYSATGRMNFRRSYTLHILVAVGALIIGRSFMTAAMPVPLIDAVRDGDVKQVAALLAKKADPNAALPTGETALHWAAERGSAEMVTLLLQAGANVSASTKLGVTPLLTACMAGNGAAAVALLRGGAKATEAMPGGETALMAASRTGSAEAVKELLARGAPVDQRESLRGQTPLMWAAAQNNAQVVQLLVAAGADINARSGIAPPAGAPAPAAPAARGAAGRGGAGRGAAAAAANEGAAAAGAAGGAAAAGRGAAGAGGGAGRGGTALGSAPAPSGAGRGTAIVSSGGGGGGGGGRGGGGPFTMTPLLFAVRAGSNEAVRTLLELGANVNDKVSDGTSALVLAIVNGHYDMASLLLKQGADPNAAEQGWNAMDQLVRTRTPNNGWLPPPVVDGHVSSIELAKQLIAAGVNVNAPMTRAFSDSYRSRLNRIGTNSFFNAARNVDIEMMRLLYAAGADPKVTNSDGTTALIVAAGDYLYQAGEDGGSEAGSEPRALESVKFLVEVCGLDVNARDANGETPLHGTAMRGSDAIAEYLASKGAKLEAKNNAGWMAVNIADAVYYSMNIHHAISTAATLRRLMRAQGIQIADLPHYADGNDLFEPVVIPDDLPTDPDGLYTGYQALRGLQEYGSRCAGCHGSDLGGTANAPTLTGPEFTAKWANRPLGDLFAKISTDMPRSQPGSLSGKQYADILSYVLQKAKYPAGTGEIPTDLATLKTIHLPPPPAPAEVSSK